MLSRENIMGLGLVGCGGACVGKHVGGCRPVGAKIGATERVGSGRRAAVGCSQPSAEGEAPI